MEIKTWICSGLVAATSLALCILSGIFLLTCMTLTCMTPMEEKVGSPTLRLSTANRSVTVFPDGAVIYTDWPKAGQL